MRIEIEQRPVDSKILRDNLRKGLERKMNKLILKGYVPVGGISSHMNTQTKPLLGIDIHEFTQTMVKYENIEVWVKESDSDRQAYADELTLQDIISNIQKYENEIGKWSRFLEPSQVLISQARDKVEEDDSKTSKKSFFGNMKRTMNKRRLEKRESKLKQMNERVAKSKSQLSEAQKQAVTIEKRLSGFYKSNPTITKENLLSSR